MTDELLIKFLLKETSFEEDSEVNHWIAASPENRKRFSEFELIWNTSKNLEGMSTLSENEAWNRFQTKIISHQQPKVKSLPQRYVWLRVAAVFFLISGSWLVYSLLIKSDYTTFYTEKKIRTEILPDGSEITMNKNSELAYASNFKGNQRKVKLKNGEVFFKVIKNKSKPFIIEANEITVQVVGTSFNVKHSVTSTEVIVETGIVRVSKGKYEVELKQGEMVVIDAKNGFKVKPNSDNLYMYYRNNQFVADNTPLWRVVEVLNEAYEADIIIENPALKNLTLTTTFKDESLDHILQVIGDTFNLKVIKSGDKIILK